MQDPERSHVEQMLLQHLGAAFNLARWLTRNDHDAEDLVQEAYLRAMKSLGGFRGTDGRAWLLMIVRNCCYTWLERQRSGGKVTAFDDEIHGALAGNSTPETLLVCEEERHSVRQAVEALPEALREVVVLRDLEGLSYKEISAIAQIPMGTVMSRLSRAREELHRWLSSRMTKEP